jgi:hypothetical protein
MAQPKLYTRGSTSAGNALVYEKKTITQVRKYIDGHERWSGFLVPNKVSPLNFFGGWRLACEVTIESIQELEDVVADMLYHMAPELGDRVSFYQEVRGWEAKQDEQ